MGRKQRAEEVATCLTRLEESLEVAFATTQRQVAESSDEARHIQKLRVRLKEIQRELVAIRREFESVSDLDAGEEATEGLELSMARRGANAASMGV